MSMHKVVLRYRSPCVADVEPLSAAPALLLSTSLTDNSSTFLLSLLRLSLHIPCV